LSQFPRTFAGGSNIRGEIVGAGYSVNTAGAITASSALLWTAQGITNLGSLGGPVTAALAVNDSNLVVGYGSVAAGGRTAAWAWRDGVMSEITTLPGATQSYAYDVSNTGYIAGLATAPGITSRPWVHRNGVTTILPIPDGMRSGSANAVNNAGIVVGSYEANRVIGTFMASMWVGGAQIDLGTLGGAFPSSVARSINSQQDVVGTASNDNGDTGFLWRGGTMYDLRTLLEPGSPSTQILAATGINDAGQIAATALVNGRQFAVLLTPVPTPGTVAVLALAGVFVIRRRR
jgi:probable HAF family extracellular repeat protein